MPALWNVFGSGSRGTGRIAARTHGSETPLRLPRRIAECCTSTGPRRLRVSAQHHSLCEAQQRERFSGVQASQPTAPEKIDATADWLLRLTSRGRNADLFMQTDAAYQASAIRQTLTHRRTEGTESIEPFQLSQPRNSVAAESGATWHLIPLRQKSAAGLRLLTSIRFETELASPFVAFQARDGFLPRRLPRRNALFGKTGLRL